MDIVNVFTMLLVVLMVIGFISIARMMDISRKYTILSIRVIRIGREDLLIDLEPMADEVK